jgi:CelD/BcsL family acetyltransferase involved in cellulose biosynthesis
MNAILAQPPVSVAHQPVVQTERGGADLVDRLLVDWRRLCEEAEDDQPFYRPEWIRAYLHAFAPRAHILLITVRMSGRLRLVLPLIEEKGTFCKVPVRKLRAPVNHHACRFDAILSAGPEGEAAIQAVREHLKQIHGWDVLQLRDALEGSAASRLAAAARADGFRTLEIKDNPSPYVSVPADAGLRKQLPVNARLRRQLRQIRREIASQGLSLKFRRIETLDADALNRFFELESSGWKGTERSSILLQGNRVFFQEIAAAAVRFGYFTLYMLELDGRLIASQFGFTHRARYYSVVVAYDEAFKQFSPGHLIIEEILNDCAGRGIHVYDMTGQNQEWKMKWTTQVHPLSHHFIFNGPWGRLTYALATGVAPKFACLLTGKRAWESSREVL